MLKKIYWSASGLGVRLAPLGRFGPSGGMFCWPFQGGASFVDLLCFCSALCLLCFVRVCLCVLCGRLLGGGAGLLALVCGVFCGFVAFPLVSWVRCGTWLYRFLIFAPLLTFINVLPEVSGCPNHGGYSEDKKKKSAIKHFIVDHRFI